MGRAERTRETNRRLTGWAGFKKGAFDFKMCDQWRGMADRSDWGWYSWLMNHLQRCNGEREKKRRRGGRCRGRKWSGCFYLLIRCSAWSPGPARWPLHRVWCLETVCLCTLHTQPCDSVWFKGERLNHRERSGDQEKQWQQCKKKKIRRIMWGFFFSHWINTTGAGGERCQMMTLMACFCRFVEEKSQTAVNSFSYISAWTVKM